MWDMMSIHDMHKYLREKEQASNKKQEARAQLRSFLDKQIAQKEEERSAEKQKKE